jgi:hypothetical protein
MSSWRELESELDAWGQAKRIATFWWRDDDAVEPTPALERLLALAGDREAPLALAVIPARASRALADRLDGEAARLSVLQHGFSHANYAPEAEKRAELGPHRPPEAQREELARGQAMLAALFEERAVPVLVPPWNRVSKDLVPLLPGLGFRGLSTHTPRRQASPVKGLIQCNTHLDVLRWRPERAFVGEEAALNVLLGHLRARRLAGAPPDAGSRPDPGEPSGILTHHLVMDTAAWDFTARLLELLTGHPAARWEEAREAFAPTAGERAAA